MWQKLKTGPRGAPPKQLALLLLGRLGRNLDRFHDGSLFIPARLLDRLELTRSSIAPDLKGMRLSAHVYISNSRHCDNRRDGITISASFPGDLTGMYYCRTIPPVFSSRPQGRLHGRQVNGLLRVFPFPSLPFVPRKLGVILRTNNALSITRDI